MPTDRGTQPLSEKSDLEVFLRVKGPELLQKHAANILMVTLLLIAAGFYFYSRSRNKAAEQAATNQNTAIAYDFAQQARSMFESPVANDAAARDRQLKARDVFTTVELVLSSDASPEQKVAAQLSKAEILWQLANAPDNSLATTQPAAGFTVKPPSSYLDDAEQAYTEILSKYPDQKEYAAISLISLAAIAETREKFDDARKWYDQVLGDAAIRSVYHDIATSRKEGLVDLAKPRLLAVPTSQPVSLTMLPPPMLTPLPSTAPATVPSVPPSTQPVQN